MREQLEKKYKALFEKYDLPYPMDARNITITIKNLIIELPTSYDKNQSLDQQGL